jgi:protein TonB
MGFEARVRRAVSENRFLQSLFTVTASSVLVCGSLLLLTSTAPWTRLPIEPEPSTPDAPRFAEISVELEVATGAAPLASDQADTDFAEDAADGTHTASTPSGLDAQALPEPVALAETVDADPLLPAEAETFSPAEQELAALGSPLDAETTDEVEDVPPAASEVSGGAPDMAMVAEAPAELAESTPPIPERPVVLASANALDPIADLLTTLQARAIASDTADAATEEVAEMLAGLPPAPPKAIASDKTEPATVEVADVLADLPAPPPLPVASEMTEPATEMAADVLAASPPVPAESESGEAEEARIVVAASPPPPLPRRKPEVPPAPKIAVSPPPAEVSRAPKAAVAATPRPERPAAQPAPQQQTAQSGGLLGIWKPMALAPADEPAVSLSKPATARPSGKAYAGQVWARLARHKPRAGQRGSASVSFAIGATGTLGAVRIARSSGNARIDQLALQTVRSAAPFPRPPSGSASYTIRIDFH